MSTFRTQHRPSKSWSSCVTAQQLIEALVDHGFEIVSEKNEKDRPSTAFRKRAKKALSLLSPFLPTNTWRPKLSRCGRSVYMQKADPEKDNRDDSEFHSAPEYFNSCTNRFRWAEPHTKEHPSNGKRRSRKDETKKMIVVPVQGMVSDTVLREARKVAGVPSADEFRLKIAA